MNFHAFSRDVILAERIISRVESLPSFAEVKDTAKIPLMIIGAPVQEHKCGTPFYQINTVGMSLIGYNIRSHVFLMRIMGINNYFPAPPEIYRKLAPACMLFPNFPASGSIQIIDGVAVVKFSDFTHGQIRENNLKLKTSSQ
ncbi:hypothetical protein SDC9_203222 [bioreactor metagenome]|uniref:Uncharacterized protein n=1 Tax=bioreactor metagenome TaxID=1076179 RepID=A0A645IVU5_9ZZZZ